MDEHKIDYPASVLPADDEGDIIDTTDHEGHKSAGRGLGFPHPIAVTGHPVLHKECRDVTDFDEDLQRLATDMFTSMYTAKGVGLAANQIGVDLKIFVYDCPETLDSEARWRLGIVCNPQLVRTAGVEDKINTAIEGCLSIPGAYKKVSRPNYAEVVGQDIQGNRIRVHGTDTFARMLQHETDHLYGRLYIDRLSAEEREDVLRQMTAAAPRYPVIRN
ncbi:peptide deformylase [Streptomyces sp. NPDC002755]